jgi:serine/threonine-protein kinase SRPK3
LALTTKYLNDLGIDIDVQYLEESIVIIDFGEAFFLESPPIDGLGTPMSYRDLWALACCIFELRAKQQLFEALFGTPDEVLHQIVQTLGKLPATWWEDWKERSEYLF